MDLENRPCTCTWSLLLSRHGYCLSRATLCTFHCVQCTQIWAHAFRDRRFHAAVNTNNGVESQNKLLKYNYLPRKKSMTLSAIVILIVESFLPETYQKYLFENYKQSSQYRSYKAFVPEYLHGRPRSTILHCLDRRSKSLKYTSDDVHVVSEEEGIFAVKGSSGKDHTVSFGSGDKMPSCTCRDWVQWHMPCKHFFAIFRLNSQWDWNRLPNRYKESAYLSSDGGALDAFFQNPSSQSEDQLSDHPMEKPNDDSIPPDEIPVHQVHQELMCVYIYIYIVYIRCTVNGQKP